MDNRFFEQPVLNSPYRYPKRHWELDKNHQPTHEIIEKRRPAVQSTQSNPESPGRRRSTARHKILPRNNLIIDNSFFVDGGPCGP